MSVRAPSIITCRARRSGRRQTEHLFRWALVAAAAVPGCGEARQTHLVPVTATPGAAAQETAPDARAVTRPPRAIATH